jgi:Ca2+/H+ antiporter
LKVGGYDYSLNCSLCYRSGVLSPEIDPVFDETTKPILIAASVLLFLLYIAGLVFSLNSHYRLIEEEELLIHQERSEQHGGSSIFSLGDVDHASAQNIEMREARLSIGIHGMLMSEYVNDKTDHSAEGPRTSGNDAGAVVVEHSDDHRNNLAVMLTRIRLTQLTRAQEALWSKKVCISVFIASLILFAFVIEKVT